MNSENTTPEEEVKSNFPLSGSWAAYFGRSQALLGRKVNRVLAQAGHDITREQAVILIKLWENDGLSQQQIAEATCKDKGSITRFLDHLVKNVLYHCCTFWGFDPVLGNHVDSFCGT